MNSTSLVEESIQIGLSILVTTLALFLVGWLCYQFVTVDYHALQQAMKGYIPLAVALVRPEPAERMTYMLTLLVAPACLFVLTRWRWPITRPRLLLLLLGLLTAYVVIQAWHGDQGFYIRGTLLKSGWWYLIPGCMLMAELAIRYAQRIPAVARNIAPKGGMLLLLMCSAALLIFSFLLSLLTLGNPYIMDPTFEAVFFAGSQAALGKTILVNLAHQYGMYPEVLAILFFFVGGVSIFKYSVVMAGLVTVVHLNWLAVTLKLFRYKWIGFLTFLGGFCFLQFNAGEYIISHNILPYYDPYYQYLPIRMLFPSLMMLGVVYFYRWKLDVRCCRRWGYTLLLSCGVLWNLDTGLPAWGSWVLFLSYRQLLQGPDNPHWLRFVAHALRQVGIGLFGFAMAVCLFFTLVKLKTGIFPNWQIALNYQKSFYGNGFMMLPMQLNHSWVLLALIYLGSFAFIFRSTWDKHASEEQRRLAEAIFPLVILGCGLFAYYQGRSHPWVFPAVTLPGFFLAGLTMDRVVRPQFNFPQRCHQRAAGVMLALYLVVFASGVAWSFGKFPLFWEKSKPASQSPFGPALSFFENTSERRRRSIHPLLSQRNLSRGDPNSFADESQFGGAVSCQG